jgi:hypothetical protein
MKYVTKLICINAPEGHQRGTHTNRGTASRPTRTDWLPTNEVGTYLVRTQVHTPTNTSITG